MSRIRIELPTVFPFTITLPVRITDINYGGHVGNDAILAILHEARIQFLRSHGLSEMEFAGVGLIMSDVGVEFKNELFYGEAVIASVTMINPAKVSFDLYYKLEKEVEGKRKLVAAAKTGMVCFDYTAKKITGIPAEAMKLF